MSPVAETNTSMVEKSDVNVSDAALAAILGQIKSEFFKLLNRPEINASVTINQGQETVSEAEGSIVGDAPAPKSSTKTKTNPREGPLCPTIFPKPARQLQFDLVTLSTFDGDHIMDRLSGRIPRICPQ